MLEQVDVANVFSLSLQHRRFREQRSKHAGERIGPYLPNGFEMSYVALRRVSSGDWLGRRGLGRARCRTTDLECIAQSLD